MWPILYLLCPKLSLSQNYSPWNNQKSNSQPSYSLWRFHVCFVRFYVGFVCRTVTCRTNLKGHRQNGQNGLCYCTSTASFLKCMFIVDNYDELTEYCLMLFCWLAYPHYRKMWTDAIYSNVALECPAFIHMILQLLPEFQNSTY